MHALGNDFMIVMAAPDDALPTAERIRELADRRRGIGFDQLLWVQKPDPAGNDAAYRIFNADGGEVEQCGNGVRCVARALAPQAGAGTALRLSSPAGTITARMSGGPMVSVNMGVPDLSPEGVPFRPGRTSDTGYLVDTDIATLDVGVVSLGNPHAVTIVSDVDTADVDAIGTALQSHDQFPERVNLGFLEVVDRSHGRLRVFERGVGETMACGTGACAAAVVGRQRGLFGDEVGLTLPGGDLVISWRGPAEPVWLTGPAHRSFEGTVTL